MTGGIDERLAAARQRSRSTGGVDQLTSTGPDRRLALGLDVGGTKLAAGVVDVSGRTRSFVSEPTPMAGGPERVIERQVELGWRAIEAAGVDARAIGSVGIACGGPLDVERGLVLSPPNFPGWERVPIVALVERAFERPVALDNDATAAAVGEHRYGAGRGARNLVYLTISTGIGGGLVLDGRPYRGATGNAGELGQILVVQGGRRCGCGRRGCLEAYASGPSIAARAVEAVAAEPAGGNRSSLAALAERGQLTARDVAEAAAAGDPLARSIWDETTQILGSAIASILNVFEPDIVLLGGGVTRAGEQLFGPVREIAHAEAMTPSSRSTPIEPAGLGDEVGVVGAAAIAFERFGSTVGARARG